MTEDPTFTDWIIHFSSTVEEWVLALSESLWIYPGISAVSMIDGFFPVVPSESVIIATSTTSYQTGSPVLVLIFLMAAVGAWCGDQIAYLLGAKANVTTWRLFKRPRWRRALDVAETQLERRGQAYIIAARFIPMGRVLVNVAAGALRYPHRRFMGVDAIAVTIWSAWSIALGTVAGAVFPEDNLLLSIVVGVVAGGVLGLFVDKVLTWFGLSQPDLPDFAGDIEQSLTDEERAEQDRQAALREERRHERFEKRASQRPIRRHRAGEASDEAADGEVGDTREDDASDSSAGGAPR